MERKFKYRLEIDYLSKEYDDQAIGTSSPISSLEEGLARYAEAIKEKCVDNEEIPTRVQRTITKNLLMNTGRGIIA